MDFERLCHNKLYAERMKCEFAKQEIERLSYIIKDGHIFVDPTKIEAV